MQAHPHGANPYAGQFAPIELPGQYQGGGNPNGPHNTGFRHELADQTTPQITQQLSHYTFHRPSFPPFSIPTDSDSLSSGFPYAERLANLRITRDQWHQFSLEVVSAAKLTFGEDAKAWATGIGTGAASSAFLLVFGPAVGYYTGKSIHKKTVVKKVKEKLAQDGELRNVLRKWNEGAWREKGMQVWMEPPTEDVEGFQRSNGMGHSDAKKMTRRFRIVVLPYDPRGTPLGAQMAESPTSPENTQQGPWGQSPVQMTQGPGWNQTPMRPHMAPTQQAQGGWGQQQPVGSESKPVNMVQELPGAPERTFIAELDGESGNSQLPPAIPPKLRPNDLYDAE